MKTIKVSANTGITEINPFVFQTMREKIRTLIVYFSPSGSNGRTTAWIAAVKDAFKNENVNEEAYWQYVSEHRTISKKEPSPTGDTVNETSF